MKKFKRVNFKQFIIFLLFFTWVYLTFVYFYYLSSGSLPYFLSFYLSPHARIYSGFTSIFIKYVIFILPITVLWFAWILTKGNLGKIKRHLRLIIVFTAIMLVASFTMIRWTTVTANYCHYGNYCKVNDYPRFGFQLDYEKGDLTPYETEILMKEAIEYKYDVAFKQIFTFGSFVFFSTFLLLKTIPRFKDEE